MLESAVHGVFVSLDVFLFYLFWEASLIPMYFLIGIWGGARRIYATVKFVLYTLTGSLLMLVALIYMAMHLQPEAGMIFDLTAWMHHQLPFDIQKWLFLAFFVAFAVKVPLFPFHTWLPDAHVEAPTACSILLAGILLKLGGYGLIRFCVQLFPQASLVFQDVIVVLSLVGIIYGAAMVLVQTDFKRMVAYSSVSHMGIFVLGLFTLNLTGLQGAYLTLINHGLSTGALFLIVGMFYERTHTRELSLYGGAAVKMPVMGLLFLPVAMFSMGVPGTNGFVNEFLVLLGAFEHDTTVGAVAAVSVVLGAAYMLRLTQKVMYGPLKSDLMQNLTDLDGRERFTLGLLVVLVFLFGIVPNLLLKVTEPAFVQLLSQMTQPVL